MRPFLIIVGLQKSGTTLLNRLVQEHGIARSIFKSEGNDFWGNEPPFAPDGYPLGKLYRRSGGDRGHEAGSGDATDEMRAILSRRLAALDAGDDPIVNKNPYLTAGLPWVRALFPEAVIVAMVRHPVANAFSLLKKQIPHAGHGLRPEDGWWGVKPAGWRDLVGDDKRLQCARQWEAVNRLLLEHAARVDRVISYDALCADPAGILRYVSQCLRGQADLSLEVAPLTCLDREYMTGSSLRSKNRHYKAAGGFAIPEGEKIELPAWTGAEIAEVEASCEETWEKLRALTLAKPR